MEGYERVNFLISQCLLLGFLRSPRRWRLCS
uniref:Uncharacterized protein n=1 Tax=Arundo donax TaxID=35708 RepID=A0A0A9C4T6_ARUDO